MKPCERTLTSRPGPWRQRIDELAPGEVGGCYLTTKMKCKQGELQAARGGGSRQTVTTRSVRLSPRGRE